MFYLTRSDLPIFIPLGFVGVYRWFWFLIKILAWTLYKPIKPRKKPTFRSSRDVTILVPTIDSGEEIKKAVRSWLKCDPYEIIFITVPKAKPALEGLAREVDPEGRKVRVITIAKPNKRNQMVAGINQVKTEITVFCDDDVLWPDTMLTYMLAPFDDKQMGGVGTSQTVLPVGKHMTIWEILSAYRISMRNIEITSSTYIDGGVCCLSGRTAAYRTCILRDPDFQWMFTHEYWYVWWFGKWLRFHQHSGDDKFLTRWLNTHQWKTYIQACKQAELMSTFKDNWRFLKQITRWTRNTWRSDIKSLFLERQVWSRYPFVAFTMFDKFFNPITLLAGPISVIYLCTRPHGGLDPWIIIVSYLVWLGMTRLIKYMPHFVHRPQDVLAIPVWIVFNIVFAIMKVYCLCTLHKTDWGTRKGADDKRADKEDYSIFLPHWQDQPIKSESSKYRNSILLGDSDATLLGGIHGQEVDPLVNLTQPHRPTVPMSQEISVVGQPPPNAIANTRDSFIDGIISPTTPEAVTDFTVNSGGSNRNTEPEVGPAEVVQVNRPESEILPVMTSPRTTSVAYTAAAGSSSSNSVNSGSAASQPTPYAASADIMKWTAPQYSQRLASIRTPGAPLPRPPTMRPPPQQQQQQNTRTPLFGRPRPVSGSQQQLQRPPLRPINTSVRPIPGSIMRRPDAVPQVSPSPRFVNAGTRSPVRPPPPQLVGRRASPNGSPNGSPTGSPRLGPLPINAVPSYRSSNDLPLPQLGGGAYSPTNSPTRLPGLAYQSGASVISNTGTDLSHLSGFNWKEDSSSSSEYNSRDSSVMSGMETPHRFSSATSTAMTDDSYLASSPHLLDIRKQQFQQLPQVSQLSQQQQQRGMAGPASRVVTNPVIERVNKMRLANGLPPVAPGRES
ncbi:hypothetical protein SmJEL517_g01322 [Synchytrium microbalum]|uniref:Glycosyltransferase 2-like domain-containing protein n=1 Tax=Synchytrium microbalum TaxID=1806994 RepID=A0A507CFD8_9FUNG|nr:uncharacterized protein SmJEL517_g01322 [Synchytrium microbalum]TPX36644.1 hypothetical protein SmJEL517_g01322 [Synchytrium microbalum]